MLAIFLIAIPLLIIIAAGSYLHWKGHSDSQEHSRTIGGYLLFWFDLLVGYAGGIALTLLLGVFNVEDRYIATAVIAMIKGGICILIAGSLIFVFLNNQAILWRRMIVYGCVLAFILLADARHDAEELRAAEAQAQAQPRVCKTDSQQRLVCSRPQ